MAIENSDLIAVNRDGVDYKASVADLGDAIGGSGGDGGNDCLDCLEAECRYIGTKNPEELKDWLGTNDGYGYINGCDTGIWSNYSEDQDIFDIYIPDGDKNPFCIDAFDRCFANKYNQQDEEHHLHYRLADGTEGTFQTEIRKRIEFPDNKAHIRIIPVEKDILPKDQVFEVWIDIEEWPDITCHHPDHNDWVYWDNIVGVPEDVMDQELHLPSLVRAFELRDSDLLLISRKGHDYAIEARHAKSYFDGSVPEFNDGRPVIHIINGSDRLELRAYDSKFDGSHMWSVDGTYLSKSKWIEANQEVIIGVSQYVTQLFVSQDGNFAIGNKTDTSEVLYFAQCFSSCNKFTGEGIEYFDTRSAREMDGMFSSCHSFNGDVTGWDVSNVRDMREMFQSCYVFNRDISKWDVSNVENFMYAFSRCYEFNQDLRGWNTMNATNLSSMFRYQDNNNSDFAQSDNSDLSQWCVPLISSRPYQFGTVKADPRWGTCPRGEDHPDWIDIAE